VARVVLVWTVVTGPGSVPACPGTRTTLAREPVSHRCALPGRCPPGPDLCHQGPHRCVQPGTAQTGTTGTTGTNHHPPAACHWTEWCVAVSGISGGDQDYFRECQGLRHVRDALVPMSSGIRSCARSSTRTARQPLWPPPTVFLPRRYGGWVVRHRKAHASADEKQAAEELAEIRRLRAQNREPLAGGRVPKKSGSLACRGENP